MAVVIYFANVVCTHWSFLEKMITGLKLNKTKACKLSQAVDTYQITNVMSRLSLKVHSFVSVVLMVYIYSASLKNLLT